MKNKKEKKKASMYLWGAVFRHCWKWSLDRKRGTIRIRPINRKDRQRLKAECKNRGFMFHEGEDGDIYLENRLFLDYFWMYRSCYELPSMMDDLPMHSVLEFLEGLLPEGQETPCAWRFAEKLMAQYGIEELRYMENSPIATVATVATTLL